MGELQVDDQILSFEQIGDADAGRTYTLEIEFERRYVQTGGTETVILDVDRRGDVTRERVAAALREWYEEAPDVKINSYEVIERVECRSGSLEGLEEQSASQAEGDSSKPAPGVDASALSPGDRVAYYVGGPGNQVYGYVTDGIVRKVPPWDRSPHEHSETVTDKVQLDLGNRTKEVPLAWIIGTTDSERVAEAIDKPRSDL